MKSSDVSDKKQSCPENKANAKCGHKIQTKTRRQDHDVQRSCDEEVIKSKQRAFNKATCLHTPLVHVSSFPFIYLFPHSQH